MRQPDAVMSHTACVRPPPPHRRDTHGSPTPPFPSVCNVITPNSVVRFFAHCCHYHYRFLLLSFGCHPLQGVTPHLFYLSDLVSPLFFVNLPTNFFPSGVTPLEGVTRGGPPPSRSPLVTPLPKFDLFIKISFSIKIA